MAVMMIAAILSAAAIPALGALHAARVEAAQGLVARDLGYSRERAIATGTPHRVAFDVAEQRYRVLLVPSGDLSSQAVAAHTTPAGGEFVVDFLHGEFAGVRIASVGIGGGASVTFDWRGTPHGPSGAPLSTGTHEVRLSGGRGVRVHAITGLAERFSY